MKKHYRIEMNPDMMLHMLQIYNLNSVLFMRILYREKYLCFHERTCHIRKALRGEAVVFHREPLITQRMW
jgi:hypothetical protein